MTLRNFSLIKEVTYIMRMIFKSHFNAINIRKSSVGDLTEFINSCAANIWLSSEFSDTSNTPPYALYIHPETYFAIPFFNTPSICNTGPRKFL